MPRSGLQPWPPGSAAPARAGPVETASCSARWQQRQWQQLLQQLQQQQQQRLRPTQLSATGQGDGSGYENGYGNGYEYGTVGDRWRRLLVDES